jgi:phosphoribosyl 1,2-cyclic phosphodiesterase
MLIRFWGTRGSIPSPGPNTARYGGNTSCIEVVSDAGQSVIVDAGTGIRRLGARIAAQPAASRNGALHLLLSHCHWDHVQGLPFFEPLRTDGVEVVVRVPAHLLPQADRILQTQLDPLFFPVTRADLRARIVIEAARDQEKLADLTIRSSPVEHPGGAVAYRLSEVSDETRSVVVAPDSEIVLNQRNAAAFEELVSGARILIHDSMYTEAEYAQRQGWGHSTHIASLELALRTGVEQLILFHHHPDRGDSRVDEMVEECRAIAEKRSGDLAIIAAYEGLELEL